MEDKFSGTIIDDAPQSANTLAGFLGGLLTCADRDLIWQRVLGKMRELGFVHLIYGYSPDSRGAELGSPDDFLIMSSIDEAVIRELVERGYFWDSMTFRWALNNTGIAKWSRTPVECGLPADWQPSLDALIFFERHGLMTGCCIGAFTERKRGRAVFALIGPSEASQSEVDALVDCHHETLFTLLAVMHQCLAALPLRIDRRPLTPRQREVLEWVAHGKTAADIALIMGISAPTVEKHLRLARETLGVETTAHAVIKAAYLNQVFSVSPVSDTALNRGS